MDILSNFSERLNEYMQYANLNSVALSEKLGVARSTVSELARGKFLPTYSTFCKIIEYFSCSADYILGLSDDPKENAVFWEIQPFATALREALSRFGKSQYELEKEQSISGSIVYDWLFNGALPSIPNLCKVARFFDCTIDFLLGREK